MLQVEKSISPAGLTEPDDLWITRMEARFCDRARRVVDRNRPQFFVDQDVMRQAQGSL